MEEVTTQRRRTPRVRIDPNARIRGLVPTRKAEALQAAGGSISIGDEVVIFEPEDAIAGRAIVREVDDQFLYLEVDWSTLSDDLAAATASVSGYSGPWAEAGPLAGTLLRELGLGPAGRALMSLHGPLSMSLKPLLTLNYDVLLGASLAALTACVVVNGAVAPQRVVFHGTGILSDPAGQPPPLEPLTHAHVIAPPLTELVAA